ncbi:MAG: DUF5939 domain-containing protein [Paracoccaceae bacterium]
MTTDLTSALEQPALGLGHNTTDVARFVDHLLSLPDHEAARINPFNFAERAGLQPDTAINLFVLGTRQGFFDLEWGMVCPGCAAIMQRAPSMDQIAEEHAHCAFCDIDVESYLDDTVEVTFSYVPAGHTLDLHADFGAYRHYYTSSSHPLRNFFTEYQSRNRASHIQLAPGEQTVWTVPVDADDRYRVMTLEAHSAFDIVGHAEGGDTEAWIELNANGFSKRVLELAAGEAHITLSNQTENPAWLNMVRMRPQEIIKVLETQDRTLGPRLTGKHLLANQTFRDSFSLDDLAPDLKLKLRSLTLLFTDLKGSTALYDREGDLAAYRLVQDHFVALKDVVRAHSGALVKTMGDAVMAAFPDGKDGARAAVDMMAAMQRIKGNRSTDDVGLKVGLHSGPALAINSGRDVDYFGQTVNIAARVQGLADEGEICISRALAETDGIGAVLAEAGYAGQAEIAHLKGVSSDEEIMRYRL